MDQHELAELNRTAWEFRAYEAWVNAYGRPALAAADLVRDPERKS